MQVSYHNNRKIIFVRAKGAIRESGRVISEIRRRLGVERRVAGMRGGVGVRGEWITLKLTSREEVAVIMKRKGLLRGPISLSRIFLLGRRWRSKGEIEGECKEYLFWGSARGVI